jgi:hypothetical protein
MYNGRLYKFKNENYSNFVTEFSNSRKSLSLNRLEVLFILWSSMSCMTQAEKSANLIVKNKNKEEIAV